MIGPNEARVNITWAGQNAELPDPVSRDAAEGDVKMWVAEAIRNGSIPGIPADPGVDLTNYVVEKYGPNDQRPHHAIFVRPKTPFG